MPTSSSTAQHTLVTGECFAVEDLLQQSSSVSGKAILSALRALQDRTKRLENEKNQLLCRCEELTMLLQQQQAKMRSVAKKTAYDLSQLKFEKQQILVDQRQASEAARQELEKAHKEKQTLENTIQLLFDQLKLTIQEKTNVLSNLEDRQRYSGSDLDLKPPHVKSKRPTKKVHDGHAQADLNRIKKSILSLEHILSQASSNEKEEAGKMESSGKSTDDQPTTNDPSSARHKTMRFASKKQAKVPERRTTGGGLQKRQISSKREMRPRGLKSKGVKGVLLAASPRNSTF